eukprot:TRINITY_DN12949_c0_g1_i1.p1 TRINITY_DN12949_c0_g1~~TRINITY_DN12949_c0_g1_i1.p1  ORF type:complete len:271 (+),score=116.06 TRINITY_DN12949_c0_g1_i1:59-814(+)
MGSVDLAATAGPRRAQMAWWDRSHAPKVTWAERREELVLVVHVQKPKGAEVIVKPNLVSINVTDDAGRLFNVDLPLKREVEDMPHTWEKDLGSSSVRVKLKKTKQSKGLWQDEVKKGTSTGNNTCLSIDPRQSKNWLAYDWEVYKEDEEEELEDEHYDDPDDEPILQLPPSGEPTEAEVRKLKEQQQNDREDELRREAESLRAQNATRPKQSMLRFTFPQLQVLLSVIGIASSFSTFLATRWYYSAGYCPA